MLYPVHVENRLVAWRVRRLRTRVATAGGAGPNADAPGYADDGGRDDADSGPDDSSDG